MSIGELTRRGGALVLDGFDHALDIHARPGHRPGGAPLPTASARRGGDTDVVRPVLVDPAVACRLAESGALFADPFRHVRIEHPDDARSRRYLVWDAVVTDGRHTELASLHLLASPSLLVTILELVPKHRIRHHRDRFLRQGIAAVDELACRLIRSARIASA